MFLSPRRRVRSGQVPNSADQLGAPNPRYDAVYQEISDSVNAAKLRGIQVVGGSFITIASNARGVDVLRAMTIASDTAIASRIEAHFLPWLGKGIAVGLSDAASATS